MARPTRAPYFPLFQETSKMALVKIIDDAGGETQIVPDLDATEAFRLGLPSPHDVALIKILGAIMHTYINYLEDTAPHAAFEFDNARTFLRTAAMWTSMGATKEG
jgi:hypothetical protein